MAVGQEFRYHSTALETAIVDPTDGYGGVLYELVGANPSGNTVFILLRDSASPWSGGDEAIITLEVPAGGTFSYVPPLQGLLFIGGIQIAVSTTPQVYAASADGCTFWVRGRTFH